jgi:hypothetical protein
MEPRQRTLTQRQLFEVSEDRCCDVCGVVVDEDDEDASTALYIWTRGDETRYEQPPICAKCGPALGLAQVRRWAIEDDEEG